MNIDPMSAIPPAVRWKMELEERELERELADRRAEAASAAEAAEQAWLVRQHVFEAVHGYTMDQELQVKAAMAASAEARDVAAPYGSRDRPAVLVDGVEIRPREETVQRSADHHMVVPGQDPGDRAFMLRMVAERDRRLELQRRERAAAEIRELEREVHANWGEISR
jgi:hypothetical protein